MNLLLPYLIYCFNFFFFSFSPLGKFCCFLYLTRMSFRKMVSLSCIMTAFHRLQRDYIFFKCIWYQPNSWLLSINTKKSWVGWQFSVWYFGGSLLLWVFRVLFLTLPRKLRVGECVVYWREEAQLLISIELWGGQRLQVVYDWLTLFSIRF